MDQVTIRSATIEDVPQILFFIKELALYEKLLSEVSATEDSLAKSIFIDKKAEVIFAQYQNTAVGFALFFHNYSTFLGKPGIYIEDLFVLEQYRGLGIGKVLLRYLCRLAIERDCGRVEWWCLDWNRSSIEFYKSIGAQPMTDWTVYRVTGDILTGLAREGDSDIISG
jgi:GNAT superfamily N-acetyltransferase